MKVTEQNYPIRDGHRMHCVRHPIITKSGKWVAVDVLLPTGYRYLPLAIEFDSYDECQKGCSAHNRYVGFDEEQANQLIEASMNAAQV